MLQYVICIFIRNLEFTDCIESQQSSVQPFVARAKYIYSEDRFDNLCSTCLTCTWQ